MLQGRKASVLSRHGRPTVAPRRFRRMSIAKAVEKRNAFQSHLLKRLLVHFEDT